MTRDEFEAAVFLLGGEAWSLGAWAISKPGDPTTIIWDSAAGVGAYMENELTAHHLKVEVKHVHPYSEMLERIVNYLEATDDRR